MKKRRQTIEKKNYKKNSNKFYLILMLIFQASGKTEELLKPTNPTTKNLNNSQYKISTSSNSPKVKPKAVSAAQLSKVNKKVFNFFNDKNDNFN